jgi:hypothetical protein
MANYEVVVDDGGGIHLYIFDGDGNVTHAGAHFEYCQGALALALDALDSGERIDFEDLFIEGGDFEDPQVPQKDYDDWTVEEYERGLLAKGMNGVRTIYGYSDELRMTGEYTQSESTKSEYVRSHMKMAPYWRIAKAIIASIPASLIEPLTAEQLVVVADALHAAHESGTAKAEAEILAEGAIYSPKHERMLEIEVPNV